MQHMPPPRYSPEGFNKPPPRVEPEDAVLNKAIHESLKQNTQSSYEPLDVEDRIRRAGEPVGLKNIGNTCYFNSLLQTLFRIPGFVRAVLLLDNLNSIRPNADEPSHVQKRIKDSVEMVKGLQDLFRGMTGSDQKYVDPSRVLNKCVDEMGEQVKVGEQMDLVEYAINFFERTNEIVNLSQGISTGVIAL